MLWGIVLCFLEGLFLVPVRTTFILSVGRRGHGQDPEVILHHLASLLGAGEGEFFPEVIALFCMAAVRLGAAVCILACESLSPLCTFINIVAVTITFLISLSPVNFSCPNP